ncbi:DEAD/DEAH box helicase [Amycolatopsis acidiphila]|uniref:DEAD/DEAH box helicase n=1 Tax=Amycolatopsis acidiphila TaxID=715473 RepID=A0A558AID6_9PSEU|nr:DEAD/DEAH box helicase [Amycolatopsis acidiphila]TVT24033.1 DEAD/DEAH box helicase [Amycolatopsis acidiphila]UIJ57822.1 DEAD/DEAH box helicase [Amycolatopsis acidiphila]GHG87865.1 ATP-dependent helicase [Amycolatopsis acidiphila]
MHSPASASETLHFGLLHPRVQRWVWQQGWSELHDIQDAAIPAMLGGETDVLIGAATAAGKTEAAFLPICSNLAEPAGPGVRALYVGPLKALINDQFRRVEELCETLEIPVHRWHGDVAGARKKALLRAPSGILLITPESLEAMFVLRGTRIPAIFAGLQYVVIDELHSFLGTERGAQLLSQLHRLETALKRRVPRIGLSATLGDMSLAAAQLRPDHSDRMTVLESQATGQELRLQLRSYVDQPPVMTLDEDTPSVTSVRRIADHMFTTLRGRTNLVFANARSRVELYSSELADRSAQARVPNEFHAHHGNLAKELREDVEAMLKDPTRPATAVCTTTLEMGIDIGAIAEVAQIGPPPSVAALRQRLGRSGRRDEPAVLRAYCATVGTDARTTPLDRLHLPLVQMIASIELLLERWCEPPDPAQLHLSTLVQQLLSLIAQHGGAQPVQAYRVLCGRGSPFSAVTSEQFTQLLRALGAHDVLTQTGDGTLLLGGRGEVTVNHYSFYAAFQTPEEYRLVHSGRQLGTMPVDFPLYEGLLLLFAGRRWRVLAINDDDKSVQLVPAHGGTPPYLGDAAGSVHTGVRTRMRALLEGDRTPVYADAQTRALLEQARRDYAALGLDESPIIVEGSDTLFFPWIGNRQLHTLAAILSATGVDAAAEGAALRLVGCGWAVAVKALSAVVQGPVPLPVEVARKVGNKATQKFDHWLGEELLCEQYASASLDCDGALHAAESLVGQEFRE